MPHHKPSATLAGFEAPRRRYARCSMGVTLLCLLATGHSALAASPAPRAKSPVRSERQSPPRRAEKRPPSPVPAAAVTDESFNECHKAPSGKRLVRVTVATSTDVNHLITWLSAITCKAFVYATDETAHGREVTLVAPGYVTPEEAFRLVWNALDAVGLTLRPSGNFYQVIESQYARVTSVPVYDYAGQRVREQ